MAGIYAYASRIEHPYFSHTAKLERRMRAEQAVRFEKI